ncbi:hypothetical protein QBC46DRAFT_169887 [Diplogelasinospora grovesii]|uniref:Uncharacterized protein n=1 Tax=Diplogelasinospora grovesii TaxID=303347 RepID=A0AAN6S1W4_9PEZI|nr:hypothetical protein QBC46DRAFT_169887 [Diplogelasinospora grovesii]
MAPKKNATATQLESPATTIRKMKVERQTDNALLKQFEELLKHGECGIAWNELHKATKIVPPRGTVAIVVDVPENKGAIRVFEDASDQYLGGVGTEHAGFMVIVPWDENWWFRVSGSLRIGYIAVVLTASQS